MPWRGSRTVEQIMRIADRYFDAGETGARAHLAVSAYESLERRIAVAMVVFLVVINQAEVAITVRLNFFNRAWFDAIQHRNETVFWQQLLFVFTPYAFLYVAMTVVEFFVQSMLVIRWRTWLTDHFVSRWLHQPQPLPDQPGRRPNRQPRPAHFRGHFPFHQRRH